MLCCRRHALLYMFILATFPYRSYRESIALDTLHLIKLLFISSKRFTFHLQLHVSSIGGTQLAVTQPTARTTTDGVYGSISAHETQKRRGSWHNRRHGNICVVRPRAPNVIWNTTLYSSVVTWSSLPRQLTKSLLTTAAVDTVDHQRSWTSAQGSFRGTHCFSTQQRQTVGSTAVGLRSSLLQWRLLPGTNQLW